MSRYEGRCFLRPLITADLSDPWFGPQDQWFGPYVLTHEVVGSTPGSPTFPFLVRDCQLSAEKKRQLCQLSSKRLEDNAASELAPPELDLWGTLLR